MDIAIEGFHHYKVVNSCDFLWVKEGSHNSIQVIKRDQPINYTPIMFPQSERTVARGCRAEISPQRNARDYTQLSRAVVTNRLIAIDWSVSEAFIAMIKHCVSIDFLFAPGCWR